MRSRLLTALTATLAAVALTPAPARATTTHDIEIDARPLFSDDFTVVGGPWLDAGTVQTVTLDEGRSYQIRTGHTAASFTFTVDANGHVQYTGAGVADYLDGAGTDRLTLNGVDTTIDARYLGGTYGVLIAYAGPNSADWTQYATRRLLPSPAYRWQQGSGHTSVATTLHHDGTWTYGSAYDGYLSGQGTTTLTFHGYPLIVDARATGASGVTVQPTWGLPAAPGLVQTAVLLPAPDLWLQLGTTQPTATHFTLTDAGTLTFAPGAPLVADTYQGTRRLSVTGPVS